MADIRACEQCGTAFAPRREHARFCSAACRAAWNREHTGDLKVGASALVWAITAMGDTTGRLPPGPHGGRAARHLRQRDGKPGSGAATAGRGNPELDVEA